MFVFICILLTVGSSDIRLSHLHSPYVPSFRIRFHDLTHSRRQYENFRSRGRIHLSEIRSTQCRKGKRPVTAYILVFSVSLSCTSMHPLTHSLSLSLSLSVSCGDTDHKTQQNGVDGSCCWVHQYATRLYVSISRRDKSQQKTTSNERHTTTEKEEKKVNGGFPCLFVAADLLSSLLFPACTVKHQSLAVQNTTTEHSRTGSRNTATNNDKHKHTDSSSPSS